MVTTPATETTVIIGERAFDLKHLSAADGAQLYDALGTLNGQTKTDYQQLAQGVGQLALNFDSLVNIPLPQGMTIKQAVEQALLSLKKGGGVFDSGASAELKNFWGQAKEAPGIGMLFSAMEGTAKTANFATDVIAGLSKPFAVLTSPIDTLGDLGAGPLASLKNATSSPTPITPEQAKAFGAAYAAALYSQTEAPNAPAAAEIREPGWWDKIQARGENWWNHISHFLSNIQIVNAVGKWFGNGFDWGKAMEDARTEIAANENKPVPTYEETLNQNLLDGAQQKARPGVAAMLTKAEEIAGIESADMAKAIGEGGIYQAQDGTWYGLSFENGQPVSEALKDANGNVLTSEQRSDNAWERSRNALLPSGDLTAGKVIGAAVGYKITANVVKGMGHGFTSQLVGENNILAQKYDKLMKPATDLYKEADMVRDGTKPIKNFWGKVTYEPANPALADKLTAQAEAMEAKLLKDPKVLELQERITARGSSLVGKMPLVGEAKGFGSGVGTWMGKQAGSLSERAIGATERATVSMSERALLQGEKGLPAAAKLFKAMPRNAKIAAAAGVVYAGYELFSGDDEKEAAPTTAATPASAEPDPGLAAATEDAYSRALKKVNFQKIDGVDIARFDQQVSPTITGSQTAGIGNAPGKGL